MDPDKIRETLLVNEKELGEKLLQRVRAHLGLDGRGKVHIHSPQKYRQKDLIALYLLGVRYAADAKLREGDTVTLTEISESLGLDTKLIAARLADLRAEGKVESPGRGDSRIVFPRADQILNEIEAQNQGDK